MDRDEALRRAEKLMRQGRLEAAIEEYAAIVEAFPRDWNTGNLLGDLFIRSGRTDRAIAQYGRIADLLARDGFLSKAAALYKKIVKISPDDEHALTCAAELAAQQGLLADARGMLQTVFQRRMRTGDRVGAVAIARRHGTLDPADVVGRIEAARMLAELGDAGGASENLRLAGDTLVAQGRDAEALRAWREAVRINPADRQAQERITGSLLRIGDLDAAMASAQSNAERKAIALALLSASRVESACGLFEQVLASEPADLETRLQLARVALNRGEFAKAMSWIRPSLGATDPRVDLAMAEAELRGGTVADGVVRLAALIGRDAHAIDDVAALAVRLAEADSAAGLEALGCALDELAARREFDRALGVLAQFHTAAPMCLGAYERHAQLCRDGRYDDELYDVDARLADLYLADRRFSEALVLVRRLMVLRPDVERHAAQEAEALEGLGQRACGSRDPSVDSRSGDPVDLAAFEAALGLPTHLEAPEDTTAPAAEPPMTLAEVLDEFFVHHREQPACRDLQPPAPDSAQVAAPPDSSAEPEADDDVEPEVIEIELGGELDSLATPDAGSQASAANGSGDGTLDAVFQRMRDESGRSQAESDALKAFDAAAAHFNEGRIAMAVECLRKAGRDSSLRFRASVMLARIALDQQKLDDAIGWLERASESPAPSALASSGVLYDLGDTLERAGERARAQAVFLELQSLDAGFRDVTERVLRLRDGSGTGQTGVRSSKGPA